MLAQFFYLAAHLLDWALQELLLELNDLLRVLGGTSCWAKSKAALTFVSAKPIALRLISRAPDRAASAEASMPP